MRDIRDQIFKRIIDISVTAKIIAVDDGILAGSVVARKEAEHLGLTILHWLDDCSPVKNGDTIAQFTSGMPCTIDNLSEAQLRDIFSGRIDNWKELGGPDQPIIVVVPGKDTGTYYNFVRLVMRVDEVKYDFMTYQASTVIEAIKYIP